MKKILFATTALVATASVAAADVSVGGAARFGIQYNEGATDETSIEKRMTINFDATAEADGGVEYFGRIRIRSDENTGSAVSGARVGVKVNGLTIAFGNINGALESTPNLYAGAVGLTGLGWYNLPINTNNSGGAFYWDSFSSRGNGAEGVEVIYSDSGFGAHLSYAEGSDQTAINVSYEFSDWTVALGYMDDGDNAALETTLLTVAGNLGDFGVGLAFGDVNGVANTRINGSYTFGSGTTITAYYTALDSAVTAATDDPYGIGVTHSLGGATLAAGIVGTPTGTTRADLGIRFSF